MWVVKQSPSLLGWNVIHATASKPIATCSLESQAKFVADAMNAADRRKIVAKSLSQAKPDALKDMVGGLCADVIIAQAIKDLQDAGVDQASIRRALMVSAARAFMDAIVKKSDLDPPPKESV